MADTWREVRSTLAPVTRDKNTRTADELAREQLYIGKRSPPVNCTICRIEPRESMKQIVLIALLTIGANAQSAMRFSWHQPCDGGEDLIRTWTSIMTSIRWSRGRTVIPPAFM